VKSILALVLLLALAGAHADEKKPDEKKASKPKPAAKSHQNSAQKAESSIGKWSRENHIWGKARPGDQPR
jgi:hypothetical protein